MLPHEKLQGDTLEKCLENAQKGKAEKILKHLWFVFYSAAQGISLVVKTLCIL